MVGEKVDEISSPGPFRLCPNMIKGPGDKVAENPQCVLARNPGLQWLFNLLSQRNPVLLLLQGKQLYPGHSHVSLHKTSSGHGFSC